jgi:tetratricopeptide (TPR) repeat protein
MKVVFSKYLLLVLICFCSVLGAKGQSYKQAITDFEETYTSRDYAKRFEIGQKLKNSFQKDLQKEPMRIAEVDNAFGDYYLWTNNYDSSQACYARAVNRVYGLKADTCFDYAFYLANMAYVLKEMGYYETSDKYYAVALPKLAYYLGSSSEQYSSYLKHYVDLKVDMDDYVNAHAYNEALLFYYKGMKGENDEMYLACLTNKGRILQGQGKYNEAVYIFANLVEATRINFPNDTLSQTTTLNNLAYCYRLLGNNSAAEQYFIEAYRLQTSCKSIPLDHQASLLNNLGIVYKAKCDYINAEKSFIKSIQLYEKAGKAGTAEITNPCNNLGDMYRINGNYEMADHYLKYAIQVREFTSGKESEAYANALINRVLLFLPMH